MNRNRARRCLTGINVLYESQTWTGTPYWMVRTRMWRQAALAVPGRVEVEAMSKTRMQTCVDSYDGGVPAQHYNSGWLTSLRQSVDVVAPVNYHWLRFAVDPSWWNGVDEIVRSTSDVREMRVNLHRGAVVWTHEDQTVAVLMCIHGEPRRA